MANPEQQGLKQLLAQELRFFIRCLNG